MFSTSGCASLLHFFCTNEVEYPRCSRCAVTFSALLKIIFQQSFELRAFTEHQLQFANSSSCCRLYFQARNCTRLRRLFSRLRVGHHHGGFSVSVSVSVHHHRRRPRRRRNDDVERLGLVGRRRRGRRGRGLRRRIGRHRGRRLGRWTGGLGRLRRLDVDHSVRPALLRLRLRHGVRRLDGCRSARGLRRRRCHHLMGVRHRHRLRVTVAVAGRLRLRLGRRRGSGGWADDDDSRRRRGRRRRWSRLRHHHAVAAVAGLQRRAVVVPRQVATQGLPLTSVQPGRRDVVAE